MKLEITQPGVSDKNGDAIAIGTVIDIKGDEIPTWLVNKCQAVAAPARGAKMVVNPAQGTDTLAGGNDSNPGGEG